MSPPLQVERLPYASLPCRFLSEQEQEELDYDSLSVLPSSSELMTRGEYMRTQHTRHTPEHPQKDELTPECS
jgi:hypothetical protein